MFVSLLQLLRLSRMLQITMNDPAGVLAVFPDMIKAGLPQNAIMWSVLDVELASSAGV